MTPGAHIMALTPEQQAARFWQQVDKKGPDECWAWLGSRAIKGYGRFFLERKKNVRAHRFAFEDVKGPIPSGLVLDHLCRNRICVNPGHLECVTVGENVLRGLGVTATRARQTHCKYGHPLSGTNLKIRTNGYRQCRICHAARNKSRRQEIRTLRRSPK